MIFVAAGSVFSSPWRCRFSFLQFPIVPEFSYRALSQTTLADDRFGWSHTPMFEKIRSLTRPLPPPPPPYLLFPPRIFSFLYAQICATTILYCLDDSRNGLYRGLALILALWTKLGSLMGRRAWASVAVATRRNRLPLPPSRRSTWKACKWKHGCLK